MTWLKSTEIVTPQDTCIIRFHNCTDKSDGFCGFDWCMWKACFKQN